MRPEVFTLRPEAPLDEVVRLLVDKKAKRLLVADDQGRLGAWWTGRGDAGLTQDRDPA
jgi:CBS domain-containing protein